MSKHITQNEIKDIVNLLRSWQFKLSWDLLIKACSENLGIDTTRQALSRKAEIKEEFNIRKRALKTGVDESPRPNSINQAHQKIARLQKRANELEVQNNLYREMFLRWQFNAERHGVTKQMLDRPLAKPILDAEHNI